MMCDNGDFYLKNFASFPSKDRQSIVEKVSRIEKRAFPSSEVLDFAAELKKKNTTMIIAFREDDSQVIGYLVYMRTKRLALLHKLCVVEQERKKGVGKSLMHSLRSALEKGGCRSIHLSMANWTVAFILYTTFVAGSPQVNYPLNLQFPPVARVGVPYNFQIAPTTFQPNPEKLQYSLIGNPSWLSINGQNRTLWGTPGAEDTGTMAFTIVAAEEAGRVANMESKLLVTNSQSPPIAGNISQQLANTGQLSGPRRLTLLPSTPFDIKFAPDTFQAGEKPFSYYATLGDHTPLPAWIGFDAPSLHFAGTTPPVTSSPQTYDLLLIASDTPEYAVASLSFTIVVSNHQLSFRPLQQTVNVTKGQSVTLSGLRSQLFLDNSFIVDSNILSATAEMPSWLSFDNRTFDITGAPPPGLMSQDIAISVKDRYGDTAKLSIHLTFKSELFGEEIGKLNIIAGDPFSYKIPDSIFAQGSERVSLDFGLLSEWLRFDADTLTISGTVAKDFATHDAQVTLTATSSDGKLRDTQTVYLHITGTEPGPEPGTNTDSSIAQPSSIVESSSARFDRPRSKRAGVITGIVIASLVGMMLVAALVILLCRRRGKAARYISSSPRSPRKTDISRPIPPPDQWNEVDRTFDVDVEKGDTEDTRLERTPERPPQLQLDELDELDLAHKRNDSQSTASTIGEKDQKILTSFDHSTWGFRNTAGPSHNPHESMRIPTVISQRGSEKPEVPPKNPRRNTAVYRDTFRSSGLPINRRLSGLGHGRHTYSPSKATTNISFIRRTLSMQSGSTRTASMLSTVPSAFPQPPTARHTTHLTMPMEKRQSIRLVPSTSGNLSRCESLVDRRTVDEKRQSYIRKRASAQSPFFGASSSRISSASFKSPVAANHGSKTAPSNFASSPIGNHDTSVLRSIERELPEILRIRKPSETPSVETHRAFPGSLRQQPAERPFARYTTTAATDRDRVQKRYERPGTAIYTRPGSRRQSSNRESLHAYRVKSSLNTLTGSNIFEDAEMSESVYSSEEEDIEEYEKRTTVRPNQYAIPPLRKLSLRKTNRTSRRVSQRDPTPFSLALEHGGKENQSSTYSIDTHVGKRPSRSSNHARTASHTTQRSSTQRTSTQRTSQSRPLSRHLSQITRHSRTHSTKSQALHSRSQSRHSTTKHNRDRSRTQSSAYPYFDALSLPLDVDKNKDEAASKHLSTTKAKDPSRDPSGNILNYALHEEPTIEELASSSIGFRASNGRVSASAKQSRLATL
ncbi:hypothetical protein P154DRAFT_484447, partial [Amniculicola lignicola CBS 123094]